MTKVTNAVRNLRSHPEKRPVHRHTTSLVVESTSLRFEGIDRTRHTSLQPSATAYELISACKDRQRSASFGGLG